MSKNVIDNQVSHIVKPLQMDASLVMYQKRHPVQCRFDVIDLDPYGSPAEFLDGAVQSISDGGMLAVTCTDMAVLCGNHSEACYAKYGSMSLKGKFCHEMALRILLSCIDSHANHYKRYIVPLVSVSADFYIRVFLQVFTSAAEVKRSASKKSLVYHCLGCGSCFFQPVGKRIEQGNSKKYPPGTGLRRQTCPECGRKFHLGGPIWSEPIHNLDFVNKVLNKVKKSHENYKTSERIIGMLTLISEELPHSPLYHTLDQLSSVVHCTTPSMIQLRSAIMRCGYEVSGSHAAKSAVKTNAPNNVIWDIMREWVKRHPLKKEHENSPGHAILSKPPQTEVSFEFQPGANPTSRQLKMTRFPENPEPEWGPKARARKCVDDSDELADKRKRNQGKRKTPSYNEERLKNFECKRFKKGLCSLGDACKYSHPSEEVSLETEENKNYDEIS
ncbi:tRNA (guanine(26)-N(2))-dimethyltransferase-like [Dendronephthya gigantea]|uniref:tRNA (guanine(26)-N(2))-dimethyltransferase-like n=1 Tax=Dendronephthya gigantea TaxID=151771 RepID=UPI00106C10A9|nr:tRNA (guanine(26)-N(2))-dimethyltransferase-like [Dendronephthya gigantea]